MEAEHLILTRFSVRAARDTPPHPAEWLEYRLGLFAAYCLPGLAAQSDPDFAWLVFCDASTPRWCLDRLAAQARDVPQMRIELTSPGTSAVGRVAPAPCAERVLVTTRIDSDDGSSVDLVERIGAYREPFDASGLDSAALNFSRGLKLDHATGRVFETFHPQSPHLTLFERLAPGRPPVTAQSGNHGRMQEAHVLHTDAGPPAWIQVVHGGNLSNHIHTTDDEVPTQRLDRFVVDAAVAALVPAAPPPPQPAAVAARAAFRQALEDSLLPGPDDGP